MKRALWISTVWGLAIGGTVLLMSTVLPWAGRNGFAGAVIEQNYREQNDASALFWTESERTLEILAAIERQRGNYAE